MERNTARRADKRHETGREDKKKRKRRRPNHTTDQTTGLCDRQRTGGRSDVAGLDRGGTSGSLLVPATATVAEPHHRRWRWRVMAVPFPPLPACRRFQAARRRRHRPPADATAPSARPGPALLPSTVAVAPAPSSRFDRYGSSRAGGVAPQLKGTAARTKRNRLQSTAAAPLPGQALPKRAPDVPPRVPGNRRHARQGLPSRSAVVTNGRRPRPTVSPPTTTHPPAGAARYTRAPGASPPPPPSRRAPAPRVGP